MSMKLAFIWVINLLLNLTPSVRAYSQTANQSPYVFRIMASGCEEPAERRLTGFRVSYGDITGIVTALHGVVDCTEIRADGAQSTFEDLEIVKIDLDRDLALLSSKQLSSAGNSVAIETNLTPKEGDNLYVVGYPVNLDTQLPTTNMTLRGMPELIDLIPDNLTKSLLKRSSPEIKIQVFSIEGNLLPGHSGVPIFNKDYRLVGVGNGGLDAGRIEISWAIPWQQIGWQPVATLPPKDRERLNVLKASSPFLFAFTISDPSGETVSKTVCKSALNMNYKNLDELKQALLITAKQSAVGELFGESLMAYAQVDGSTIKTEQIRTSTTGYVHVTGIPAYKNHESNLAEVCITIEAYVTEVDRKKFEPIEIAGDDEVCITENLPLQDLKKKAEAIAVIRALQNFNNKLKGRDENELLSLMRNKEFSGGHFDSKTGAYCVALKGKILPVEIESEEFATPETPGPIQTTPTLSPAPQAIACITAQLGSETPVKIRLDSLFYSSTAGGNIQLLPLTNGQKVPFSAIKSFEAVEINEKTIGGVKVAITLLNGDVVTGVVVNSQYDGSHLTGATAYGGEFNLRLLNMKRVEFRQEGICQ